MGYYTRVFCTNPVVPDLASIQNWLRSRGSTALIDDPDNAVGAAREGVSKNATLGLSTSAWEQIGVAYRIGKLPFLAECNRDDGTATSLMRREIDEFIESLGKPGWFSAKRRVLSHLRATKFIVACQLPTSDMTDDGYQANSEFLNYFVEHCGGMIQADGERCYEGSKRIVRVD